MADADVLPMWVADMDFETVPAITKALRERVAQGIFGYTYVPDSYYEAVIGWFKRRHDWTVEREWILYTSGVVPAISCSLTALTLPGEKVLVQTPEIGRASCRGKSVDLGGRRIIKKNT